ncbi:hypothetical protein [Geothrix campi]|jgi:hypothetical protein|uniref:hypothetical protein n=1 Tax=Geothrix campi TaxID=2966450 RepID=UPI002148C326|nr:hypothetical protein [Geothrix sp. SG10]
MESTPRLGFLPVEERFRLRKEKIYRVMLFRELGSYPRGTIHVPNGFFHADDEIVFSVVYGNDWNQLDPDLPYSEFDWASPEEIHLLASILLCEKRDDAYISFYPLVNVSLNLDADKIDLSTNDAVMSVRTLLLETAKSSDKHYARDSILSCLGKPFSLIAPERYNLDRLQLYWDSLSPSDYVLIRGVYSLIKCDMLCRHYEFWEEALLTLYIALEASFQIVLEVLAAEGIPEPNAHDAAVWLHEHFDKPFGISAPDELEKYFEEFYEERIMTLHPSNRFGEYPFSPTMHDDVNHLRRALREIFAYIVSGSHGPDFEEDLHRNVRSQ